MKRLLGLLCCGAALAAAEDLLPEINIRHYTFAVSSENDKYFAGTDQHYTNGFKLTWLGETDLNQSRRFVQEAARFIPWMDPEHVDWRCMPSWTTSSAWSSCRSGSSVPLPSVN